MVETKIKKETTVKVAPSSKEGVATTKKSSKLDRTIFDLSGKEVGTITLPKEVFGVEVNEALLRQAVRVYQANKHQGTSSTKTRAEVRGGGRKPWKQKGTGRARQGSIRSPQWRGGGVIFGPKPRDLSLDLPLKMKKAALLSALSRRAEDVVVVSEFKMSKPKTKQIATVLKKLDLPAKTLFVLPEFEETLTLASRNLPYLRLTKVADLNALEVLSPSKLVFSKDALGKFTSKGAV